MSNDKRTAFLASRGNSSLDFTRRETKTHFIVSALTLPDGGVGEAVNTMEAVQRSFFGNSRSWSSDVGSNHARRSLVLEALAGAPFVIFALIVDKRQLVGQGLRYKGSFFKFVHGPRPGRPLGTCSPPPIEEYQSFKINPCPIPC